MLYCNIWRRRALRSLGAGAFVGMTWVRSSIKHGARLALFALAIQFVLSFGHFYGLAQATPAIAPGAPQSAPFHAECLSAEEAVVQDSAIASAQPQPGPGHDS